MDKYAYEALAPLGTVNAMKDMLDDIKGPNARMHIRRFENFYIELVNFIHGKENNIARWFSVVGGAHVSVEVYDDSQKVIFIVPSILNRLPTDNRGNNGLSVAQQTSRYHDLLNSNPIAASNYIKHQFSQRNVKAVLSPDVIRQWNDILAHYKKPLLDLDPVLLPSIIAPSTIITDDDDEDELF